MADIAANNPDAARRMADAIRGAAVALGQKPTGRPGRLVGMYEKSIARFSYIIAYAIS
jgi:toxin ParE1/3/4